MSILDNAVTIKELGQGNLHVVWGKSGSGKTHFGGTYPKPMLYLRLGDDGSNTIADIPGVKAIQIDTIEELKEAATALVKDKKYKTVFVDTFSMLTNVWIDQYAVQKKKKMTQQMWGDLKIDTEELVKKFHSVARTHIVLLSLHETNDSIEGMEDEIIPDIRPNTTKGARTYLEGMANYGIHTTKLNKVITSKKTGEEKEIVKHAIHIGANPYYWTKLQVSADITIPKLIYDPTYDKLMNLVNGGE